MYLVIFANIHVTFYQIQCFDRRKYFQRFASQYWNIFLNNKGNLTSWWEHYQFTPFSLMTLFYSQKLTEISVCVCSASILITSFVYYSIDTNIIYWYWVFPLNMCMYGGTHMGAYSDTVLYTTKKDNFESWWNIIFVSRYFAYQVCFGYLKLIAYNIKFKFPAYCWIIVFKFITLPPRNNAMWFLNLILDGQV